MLELVEEFGVKSFRRKLVRGWLKWVGHVERMGGGKGDDIRADALELRVEGEDRD